MTATSSESRATLQWADSANAAPSSYPCSCDLTLRNDVRRETGRCPFLFSSAVIERLERSRGTAARRMGRRDEDDFPHSPRRGRLPRSLQSRSRSRISVALVSQLLRENKGTACRDICLFICLFLSSSWHSFLAGWSLYWAAERVLLFARRLLVYLFVYLFVSEFVLAFLPSRLKPLLSCGTCVIVREAFACLSVCLSVCFWVRLGIPSQPAEAPAYWAAERVLLFARRLLVYLFVYLFVYEFVCAFLPSRLKPLLSYGTCVIVRETFACLFVCLSVC